MAYYAIQVRSRFEARYIALARSRHEDLGESLFFLRRSLRVKKGGAWRDEIAPIFSGYVFLRADTADPEKNHLLHTLPGFVRFLPANDRIAPLDGRDEAMLRHFLSFGEVAAKSIVDFDENRRIRVISGPLKGLDGLIIKVDRRKQRAKVRLALYQDKFEIDFGFQALEPSVEPQPQESPPG